MTHPDANLACAVPTVLGIAAEDEEIAAFAVSRALGDSRQATWHLNWSRLDPDHIRELRIRVARSVTRLSPFLEFTDITLP